jgi:fatty-acyl-CoA synthase
VKVRSGRRFTYADLNRRANAMARASTDHGLKKGDHVGILSRNRVEYLDAFFAAGKTSVILVPLSTRFRAPELDAQIEDSGVRVVLYSRAYHGMINGLTLDEPPLESSCDFVVHCDPEALW